MNLYTEDAVLNMKPEALALLRAEQSDAEREDILAGKPSRFEGCIRCEDVWVIRPTEGASTNGTEKRTRNVTAVPAKTVVPVEHG